MDESRKSGGAGVAVVAIAMIALPILYVLSLGPAGWLIEHNYLERDTARIIYYPIVLAAENTPIVQSILQWYMELFV